MILASPIVKKKNLPGVNKAGITSLTAAHSRLCVVGFVEDFSKLLTLRLEESVSAAVGEQ